MATKYPYFVVTRLDAGMLVKLNFGVRSGKKFSSYTDALIAVSKVCENDDRQFCILRYTSQYECEIKCIINGNNVTNIMYYN